MRIILASYLLHCRSCNGAQNTVTLVRTEGSSFGRSMYFYMYIYIKLVSLLKKIKSTAIII